MTHSDRNARRVLHEIASAESDDEKRVLAMRLGVDPTLPEDDWIRVYAQRLIALAVLAGTVELPVPRPMLWRKN